MQEPGEEHAVPAATIAKLGGLVLNGLASSYNHCGILRAWASVQSVSDDQCSQSRAQKVITTSLSACYMIPSPKGRIVQRGLRLGAGFTKE
jgi:hypothetical protein